MSEVRNLLLDNLTDDQKKAVKSKSEKVLVVAGAGSGKTEVMARRIAWWIAVEGVSKEKIVAFTFTEKAAEEMKYRVRKWVGKVTPAGEDVNLGGMYVGTIHGFCLAKIREFWPDEYHNYDILDEAARNALILRGFNNLLALKGLQVALDENKPDDKNKTTRTEAVDQFLTAYDQLHEHNRFEVKLSDGSPPYQLGIEEQEWCKKAQLNINVGEDVLADSFAVAAARYYAYLRCRRFLDFSTSQSEYLKNLKQDKSRLQMLEEQGIHLVVDEVQDINPVQKDLIFSLIGKSGKLTAVGDHRQSIYGFRGAKVEIIGEMWDQFQSSNDSEIIDLRHNFRSTPRIVSVANSWAKTISPAGGMQTLEMLHGKETRTDIDPSHVALVEFNEREDEAAWIAEAIRAIVPSGQEGAEHDRSDGTIRGLALSDIAILVRSSTNIQTYMQALESVGIPSIVRAGPDLFSQPEVLLFLATFAITANIDEFYGSQHNYKSLPSRINDVLRVEPKSDLAFRASAKLLRKSGLSFGHSVEDRLFFAAKALKDRILEQRVFSNDEVKNLKTKDLREFLMRKNDLRRVFPQRIYHWLLSEAEVESWDTCKGRGETAMFHLGALSGLVTGIETPGWTSASDYRWQIIGLSQYGAREGRAPEQPLMVQPDAVTISTIHSVKGLEFAAVFLADVCARRFPSSNAKKKVKVPISGEILSEIDIDGLSDNQNNDGERRLMYVALTRAERFLIVSRSGKQVSKFIKELKGIVKDSGGVVTQNSDDLLDMIRHAPLEYKREVQLATSFSDLRYYLGCPHDFYLRKVLGFAPTIDQAFGYGRGVHNLMRAIHADPNYWASIAQNRSQLESKIEQLLIDRGLFYLRYTTGDPAENMRRKGVRIAADYVEYFVDELKSLIFEPEKEFETLVEYEDEEGGAMISGAIDIVRRDDPPRVTLIDFKSGDPESDSHQKLDEEEMRLQVSVYAMAAKKELQYAPEKGLVRYLDVDRKSDDSHELNIKLDDEAINDAKRSVIETAVSIRDRKFLSNPKKLGRNGRLRCESCDFVGICGMESAMKFKAKK